MSNRRRFTVALDNIGFWRVPRLIRSFVMVVVEAFESHSPHYLPMPA